jgi:hypothetical protein
MKKKMGLLNENQFDNIDDESVESRIKKDLHTSVIEYIVENGRPDCNEVTMEDFMYNKVSEQVYMYCTNKDYYDNLLSGIVD